MSCAFGHTLRYIGNGVPCFLQIWFYKELKENEELMLFEPTSQSTADILRGITGLFPVKLVCTSVSLQSCRYIDVVYSELCRDMYESSF